jgi:hypothetical protein
MIVAKSFYDTVTGRFHSRWVGPEIEVTANTPAGMSVMDGHHDMNAERVDTATGSVVTRAATPVAASASGLSIVATGLPIGAHYTISGDSVLAGFVADANTTFAFSLAGTYTLWVECFPDLDYRQEFTLT